MTGFDVLLRVLEVGGKVAPGPGRPRLLAPPAMRPLVDALTSRGLLALVPAHGYSSGDAFRRAKTFRQQLDAWAASGRFGVPVLVKPESPEPRADRSISCGCSMVDAWRRWSSMPGCQCGPCAGYLEGPPGEALPCYRIGDKIVVKRSEYDGWVQQFRSARPPR